MKPSGGIAQKHIHMPGLCCIHRIKDHAGGIRAFRPADHINARPVGPARKLFPCGGAESIRCGNQHLPALFLEHARQLAHRGGLSHAVYADYQNHRLLLFKVIGGFPYLHLLLYAVDEQLFAGGGLLDMLFLHLLLQAIQNIGGGIYADIPHNQDFFQFFIKFIVNRRKAAEYGVDSMHNIISCFIQALFQPGKKALLFFAHSYLLLISRSISNHPAVTISFPNPCLSGLRLPAWKHPFPAW